MVYSQLFYGISLGHGQQLIEKLMHTYDIDETLCRHGVGYLSEYITHWCFPAHVYLNISYPPWGCAETDVEFHIDLLDGMSTSYALHALTDIHRIGVDEWRDVCTLLGVVDPEPTIYVSQYKMQ